MQFFKVLENEFFNSYYTTYLQIKNTDLRLDDSDVLMITRL